MSNLSFVRYVGDGKTVQFALAVAGVNIGYFRTTDIHGYVDGKEVAVIINPSTPHMVNIIPAPVVGADILLRREMPEEKPYADFERGNNFGHRQVNNTFLQQLYLTQELLDGFLPNGFYWKQDTDMGGFNISNVNKVVTKEIETDVASIGYLSNDLDMRNHRLLNLPIPTGDKEPIRKGDLSQVSGVAPSFLYVDSKIRTDAASQLGWVYTNDWTTGIVIPDGAMTAKLAYWYTGQFYSVGTDTGFTSNDFDDDLASGRFVSTELITKLSSEHSKYPDLIFAGSFGVGCTVISSHSVVKYTNGYYVYKGALPHTVPPNSSPDTGWLYAGTLDGSYDVTNPKNFGVEYNTTTEQKDKFQNCMDFLSFIGDNRTIYLDGFVYLAQTINETNVPDPIYGTNPQQYFLRAVDNIHIRSRAGYDAGFRVAGGVVAANHSIQYSKGFIVFTNHGRKVKNFSARGFTIDYNGKNNYVYEYTDPNFPQALTSGFWFIEGEDIYIDEILHKECSGQQPVVLDYLVDKCSVKDNIFYKCGGALEGNTHINDHSSVFCLATNYEVSGNLGVGWLGEFEKPNYIGTFLECHGQSGDIHSNMCIGYGAGAVLAAFRNDFINVKHHDNIYLDVEFGINYDGVAGRYAEFDSHDNLIVLRRNKPVRGKMNIAQGHTQYQFVNVTKDDTAKRTLRSSGNVFVQRDVDGDWDGNNLAENSIFVGGKFDDVYLDDRVYGFKGGYRLNYSHGNKMIIKDELYTCGSSTTSINIGTSLIQLQNIDTNFTGNMKYMQVDCELDKDCLYTTVFFNGTAQIPKEVTSKVEAYNWLGIYAGHGLNQCTDFYVNHKFQNINTTLGLVFNELTLHGVISVQETEKFLKTKQNKLAWIYRGFTNDAVAPTTPRPFGDRRGDKLEVRNLSVGGYENLVCVMDGATTSTVGTWAGSGKIESL